MIRLSIFTLLAMLMVSCGNPTTSNENVAAVEAEGDVFSNAFDGFLNIRESPNANSFKVGELKNGPKGATMIEFGAKWSLVSHNGVEGYVKTEFLQTTPTKPALLNPEDVIGVWGESNHFNDLLIFDNGTYATYNDNFCEGAITGVGTWRIEEKNLILTEHYDLAANFAYGDIFGNAWGKGIKSNKVTIIEDPKPENKMKLLIEAQVARESEEGYVPIWSQSQLDALKKSIRVYFK